MAKYTKDLVGRFGSEEKNITRLVMDQKGDYYGSTCFKKLKNRMSRLDDSVDMRFHPTRSKVRSANNFKSKICMPLVREKYRMFTGMALASFRGEPISTILPEGDTPRINATVAQEVMNQNFRRTEFRAKAWRDSLHYVGRYGVAVMPMRYQPTKQGDGREKTVYGPFGFEKQPMGMQRRHNVYNYTINPLNYYQDKGVAQPTDSPYNGWIERVPLSRLIHESETDPNVIKKNMREVIKRAMDETISDPKYFSKGEVTDWQRVGVDVTYHYGKLQVRGNEGDERCYYLEMAGDKIIRFGTNPNDEGLIPLSIITCDPRLEYWWGNTPIENSVPMENLLNMILQMRADQAAQLLERFLFIDSNSGVDPAEMNRRKHNGGIIPFRGKQGMRPQDIFFEYQPRDFSANSIEPIIREVKEADQRLSFETDFQRSAAQGGPQNETATAAMMMDEKGNVLKSELLEAIAHGLTRVCRGNVVILQQQLPDMFQILPENGAAMTVHKSHLLGQYRYQYHTSLTKNKVTQMTNLMNFVTQMVNFQGSGNPAFQAMNLTPVVQELTRKYDLDIDIGEVFPPQQPQQAMPQAQALPGGNEMNLTPMQEPPQAPPVPAQQPAAPVMGGMV